MARNLDSATMVRKLWVWLATVFLFTCMISEEVTMGLIPSSINVPGGRKIQECLSA